MKKKLERDEEKAVVAGVLSGMANYYEQDPVLFRIIAITFLLITGVFPGLLVYIVAWFIIPRKQKREPMAVDYEVVE